MHPTEESRSRVGAQKPCGAAGRGGEESAHRSSDRVFCATRSRGFGGARHAKIKSELGS